jgi:hypothetical protein
MGNVDSRQTPNDDQGNVKQQKEGFRILIYFYYFAFNSEFVTIQDIKYTWKRWLWKGIISTFI